MNIRLFLPSGRPFLTITSALASSLHKMLYFILLTVNQLRDSDRGNSKEPLREAQIQVRRLSMSPTKRMLEIKEAPKNYAEAKKQVS